MQRGWWGQMLNASINSFSLYTSFSQTNFMRKIVTFLSLVFRINRHKYFPDDDNEFVYSFDICRLERQQWLFTAKFIILKAVVLKLWSRPYLWSEILKKFSLLNYYGFWMSPCTSICSTNIATYLVWSGFVVSLL